MMPVPAGVRVLVATRPVDFRKGPDGLAALVRETLRLDPFSGMVFVFRSKRADRVKILAWDGSGLVMLWKRLERGAFKWPPVTDGGDAAQRGAAGGAHRRDGLVAAARSPRGAAERDLVAATE